MFQQKIMALTFDAYWPVNIYSVFIDGFYLRNLGMKIGVRMCLRYWKNLIWNTCFMKEKWLI